MSEKLVPDYKGASAYLLKQYRTYAEQHEFIGLDREVARHVWNLEAMLGDLEHEDSNWCQFLLDPRFSPPQARKLAEALFVAASDIVEMYRTCYPPTEHRR